MTYRNFRHYLRLNAVGDLQRVSKRPNFPKDDKDEMIIYIHQKGLKPELVFELDDLYSDYFDSRGG